MKIGRIAEISKVFLEEGLGSPPVAGDKDASEDPSAAVQRAIRYRRALERLGPTFVKFGQLLATRVDLFDEDVLVELRKLRTHVPPFSSEEARSIVEQELGAPVSEAFSEFSEAAVASASIAQVYRARLRSTGMEVAVKVQRPRLEETLFPDLEVLMQVSQFIDKLVPAYHRSLVHRVAAEYASRARQETDFLAEAEAIERFREVLTTLPEFRVPAVSREHCTTRLLVIEWFEGRLLDEIGASEELVEWGTSPYAFATAMLRLQLGMSYEHGFVHGDTHPGNIILLRSGHIGLIDFGLHGQVPRHLCDKMLELLYYQSSGRTDEALRAFVQVFTPSTDAELDGFERELRGVLEQSDAPTAEESRMTAQLIEGLRVGARYKLQARSELFVVLRNLTIVEGIVLQFCPKLDLLAEVRRITGDILKRRALHAATSSEMQQVLPMLLLTLSQRPLLADRLLRLERSFNESRSLGEFLRREEVLRERPAPPSLRGWIVVLVGLVGALLGATLAHGVWS